MKELKCPKCGNVFQVDEVDYASIVSQVKNAEFNEEVNHRLSDLDGRHKVEQDLAARLARFNLHIRHSRCNAHDD